MFPSRSIAIALAAFFSASALAVPVKYSYQGPEFTSYSGDWSWLGGLPTAITGFVVLDQPVPSCFADEPCNYSFSHTTGLRPEVLDLEFSDGITTYSLAQLTALPRYRVNLWLRADGNGDIDLWGVDIGTYTGFQPFTHYSLSTAIPHPVNGEGPPTWNPNTLVNGDATIYCGEQYGAYGCYDSNPYARAGVGGTWTTSFVTPVPIPAAAWLFAGGLGALGLARRRSAA